MGAPRGAPISRLLKRAGDPGGEKLVAEIQCGVIVVAHKSQIEKTATAISTNNNDLTEAVGGEEMGGHGFDLTLMGTEVHAVANFVSDIDLEPPLISACAGQLCGLSILIMVVTGSDGEIGVQHLTEVKSEFHGVLLFQPLRLDFIVDFALIMYIQKKMNDG